MANKPVIERYFQLRQRLNEINAEIESLKPEVIAALREQNGVAELDGYDLLLRNHILWEYSPEVSAIQASLNTMKLKERNDGVATMRNRSDMLVLKPQRGYAAVFEEPAAYGDWEIEAP